LNTGELRALFDGLTDSENGLCAHASRFGEAQVIEAIAAWGAGRLDVAAIDTLSRAFLRSDRVIRLVNADPTGRTPSLWSTVAHRRLEDRVLDHLAVLHHRSVAPLDPTALAAALGGAADLGDDQAATVTMLCREGAGLHAVIAPAGYGKTTTLGAAVDAARRAGRPVLAVSTTNQAVGQLCQVDIPATTVARFALDPTPLPADAIVIVDEFSQLSTRDAEAVLADAVACPGGQVWMVGDPLQAQPVGAGGLATWLSEQVQQGQVPMAELMVNRRQADPIERHALGWFRTGNIPASQQLRDQAGWEHHHPDRVDALRAMAAAVLGDLAVCGPERVAALAVTHADCEALADHIRDDLVAQGAIGGPVLEGPGWIGSRAYQAGDRVLLHHHVDLDGGRRLTNGSVLAVTEVTPTGLRVTDTSGQVAHLPAEVVQGRSSDGRPLVSHAWARTIDGVQGGTWDQVHLLATPALDRYRGYVGQSRSIAPTHTWNTTRRIVDDGDHGGRLVQEPHSTTAEQIAAPLARAQPKTFAATRDPYRIERDLRAEQDDHRTQLGRRPPDHADRITRAEANVRARQRDLSDWEQRLDHWRQQHAATAGLRGLTRGRRQQSHQAARHIQAMTPLLQDARHRLERAITAREQLTDQQTLGHQFDVANQWRAKRITQLDRQIAQHWTDTVIDAARDGYPTAYGTQHLHAARDYLAAQTLSEGHTPLVANLKNLQLLDHAIKDQAQQAARVRLRIDQRVYPSHKHVAPQQDYASPTRSEPTISI
jgi:hypothetical protein